MFDGCMNSSGLPSLTFDLDFKNVITNFFLIIVDTHQYEQFTANGNDITQMTSSGNSLVEMSLTYKHTVTAIDLVASVLDPGGLHAVTSVSVYYKKMSSEVDWRIVTLKQVIKKYSRALLHRSPPPRQVYIPTL